LGSGDSVGSLRWIGANWVENAATVLKNGTGGGAPDRDEVAPYVMENALQHDRHVLWQQASGSGMSFDLDLGAARAVRVAGLHGHRALTASGGIVSCVVQYASTYPPGGGWTNAGSIGSPGRDAISIFASTQTFRYWRFDMEIVGGVFTLGKLLLANVPTEVGSNPSSQEELRRLPNLVDRTAGEDPIVTIVGDLRTHFALHFQAITATVLAQLKSMAARAESFILIDMDDTPWEVIVEDHELEYELVFADDTTKLYNAILRLEQLG